MQMSMLQTMMREHQREIEDVRAEIEDAETVAAELRERLNLNVKYFEAVCGESIRASTELFSALMDREQARLEKLRARLADLSRNNPDEAREKLRLVNGP